LGDWNPTEPAFSSQFNQFDTRSQDMFKINNSLLNP